MSLVVNNNLASLSTHRYLQKNNAKVSKTLEHISSGLKINHAADGSSGLSISETLRTQIRGNKQAASNIQDGINILQVAEGGLSSVAEHLQRIRELTIQAANDTNATNERTAIAQEVAQRVNEIDRLSNSLKFNTITLLDGSATGFTLQVGANSVFTDNAFRIGDVLATATSSALSININSITVAAGGAYTSGSNARSFITSIENAITKLNQMRGKIGAYQNRLENSLENISTAITNIASTDSNIRDADMAEESAKMVKHQVIQQANISVMSQTNQNPTMALKLLQ